MSFCKLIVAIFLVLVAESAAADEVAKPARFNPAIYPAEVERAMHIAARRMTATPFAFKTP